MSWRGSFDCFGIVHHECFAHPSFPSFLEVDPGGYLTVLQSADCRQNVNFATDACSRAAISLDSKEAVLVSLAPWVVFLAAVATPLMFFAISLTPWAASFTLRPISLVVAVCSSTAEAMLLEMSLIWLMMVLISSIAVTAPW